MAENSETLKAKKVEIFKYGHFGVAAIWDVTEWQNIDTHWQAENGFEVMPKGCYNDQLQSTSQRILRRC